MAGGSARIEARVSDPARSEWSPSVDVDLLEAGNRETRASSPVDGVDGGFIHDSYPSVNSGKARKCRTPLVAETAGTSNNESLDPFAGSIYDLLGYSEPLVPPLELTMQLIYGRRRPIGGKCAAESATSPVVSRRRSMWKE